MYELILKDFGLSDDQILNVYPYGSRVYGTHSKDSDHDFILVMKSVKVDSDRLDSTDNPISITTYLEETFKEKVAEQKIFALEAIFCPSEKILKKTIDIPFKLNKTKLRESISEKCSKDWNQAKKRFSDSQGWNPVTNQPYVQKVYEAKKSLFHCFRMIDFAMQILEKGKIVNFHSCNILWLEIYTNPSENWEDYKEAYHKEFNSRMTEFRKLAPK